MKIEYTTDLSKFKTPYYNRQVKDKKALKDLEESLLEYGYIKSEPIKINTKNEVLDGNHRLYLCRKLNLGLSYVITNLSIKEVKTLNTVKKVHDIYDVLHQNAKLNMHEYVVFNDFFKEFNEFPLGDLITLNGKTSDFRNDKFVFRNILHCGVLMPYLQAIGEFYEFYNSRYMIKTFNILLKMDSFDKDYFLDKVSRYPRKLYHVTSTKECKEMVKELYNYRNSKKIYINE